MRKAEIEDLLLSDLNRAADAYRRAPKFCRENMRAKLAWTNALREFTNFVLHGAVPVRLRFLKLTPRDRRLFAFDKVRYDIGPGIKEIHWAADRVFESVHLFD